MVLGIIAAGESSRMRAEGIQIPKPLVTIAGIPIIERIIGSAARNGIDRVCCIVNENSLELRDHLESLKLGPRIDVLVRSTPSSMHSLFALEPMLSREPFLLSTADTVFQEEEFGRFVTYVNHRQIPDGVLAVTQFVDDEKPLCVTMDQDRQILAFNDETSPGAWATGGIYYFKPRVFEEMHTAGEMRIVRLRNFLRLLRERGYILEGYPFSKIIDVDHLHDVTMAEEFVRADTTHYPPTSSRVTR
jgi:NDP-sugar pyrophosphorylase family protein